MRSFKSILLTGGAGFIGSTLLRKLLERPDVHRVVVLDAFTYAGDRGNLTWGEQLALLLLVQYHSVVRLLRELRELLKLLAK